jgi:hypothetical protein
VTREKKNGIKEGKENFHHTPVCMLAHLLPQQGMHYYTVMKIHVHSSGI